jgi:hypothetical protein
MNDEQQPTPPSDADAELRREILQGREFSLAEAIGRLAGPGMMKGVSPVARMQQAEAEVANYLGQHLGTDCLPVVLLRHVAASDVLLNNFDQPLIVLAAYVKRVLDSEYLLKEVVREADVEWGRMYDERPQFDIEGQAPQPDDPYTLDSVRAALTKLIETLATGGV